MIHARRYNGKQRHKSQHNKNKFIYLVEVWFKFGVVCLGFILLSNNEHKHCEQIFSYYQLDKEVAYRGHVLDLTSIGVYGAECSFHKIIVCHLLRADPIFLSCYGI
jgi:hypothetical protein